jgi:3-hydroxy-3-methylglutaryl CoA synthase
MVGITAYGAYIPLHRIDRAEFKRAWGSFAIPGERAVANFDEDSITMAVEAATDCLNGIDPNSVDGLFFATTSSPYKEREGSSIVATALDLRADLRTMDVAGSLRAGSTAIASGLDAIQAGSARTMLIAVADCRQGAPSGDLEQALGDGAAALLLGNEGVIAEVLGSYFLADDFSGMWRADGDTFVRFWEDRMVLEKGYMALLQQAMAGLMQKCGLAASDFAKAVYDAPFDIRWQTRLASSLGIDAAKVQDPMSFTVGHTGVALSPMMLVAALEEANPGDKILFANYGNGASAFVFQVTPAINGMRARRGIKRHLESKRMLNNYETYLRWRQLIQLEPARRPEQPPTSISALWRNRKEVLGLYGARCRKCGTPQYSSPGASIGATPARICVQCQAKDDFEPYRFADRRATVFTFTQDNLADNPDPPATVAVVDFEGGGRAVFDMTDRDPAQVSTGMPVEMTFRKLYSNRGIHNYFWKARPIRC